MRTSVTALIASAGTGSRIGLNVPKALIEVGGEPILVRQLQALRAAGVEDIVVVAGYRAEQVLELVSSIDREVVVTINHDYSATGTAASLRLGAAVASENVLAVDGDVLFDPVDIALVLECGPSLAVTALTSDDPVYARLSVDRTQVIGLSQVDNDSDELEWVGIAYFSRTIALAFGDGHVYPELSRLLPARAVYVDAVEIDYPDDIARAEGWVAARAS